MVALMAEGAGRPATAARLIRTCESIRGPRGEPAGGVRVLAPVVRKCHERVAGAPEEEDRAMTAEEAIAFALADLASEG
jgi:hypothetical protein